MRRPYFVNKKKVRLDIDVSLAKPYTSLTKLHAETTRSCLNIYYLEY